MVKARIHMSLGYACGDGCCYDYEHESQILELTEFEFECLEKAIEDAGTWLGVPIDGSVVPNLFDRLLLLEQNKNESNYINSIELVEI